MSPYRRTDRLMPGQTGKFVLFPSLFSLGREHSWCLQFIRTGTNVHGRVVGGMSRSIQMNAHGVSIYV